MARTSRTWFAVWDLLSPEERRQALDYVGLPRDYRPELERPPTREQRLEGLRELQRIMPLTPGRIAQWREELIERVEPEEGE